MAQIRKLAPHDPLPEGGRHVVLLRRFEEDDPRRIVLETIVSRGSGRAEARLAVRADGTPMSVAEALRAARALAEREHLDPVYIIDRLAGPREREILRAHGDHSVHMGQLDDFDLEEGERGPDMRDRHSLNLAGAKPPAKTNPNFGTLRGCVSVNFTRVARVSIDLLTISEG